MFAALPPVKYVSLLPFLAFYAADIAPSLVGLLPILDSASLKINIILLGMLFFSVATFTYWCKCPDLIQRHASSIDYALKERVLFQIQDHTLIYRKCQEKYLHFPPVTDFNRNEVLGLEVDLPEEYVLIHQMRYLFDQLDTAVPKWATFSFLLYVLGLSLVLTPLVANLIKLISVLI